VVEKSASVQQASQKSYGTHKLLAAVHQPVGRMYFLD
jgi:hypothetical protein